MHRVHRQTMDGAINSKAMDSNLRRDSNLGLNSLSCYNELDAMQVAIPWQMGRLVLLQLAAMMPIAGHISDVPFVGHIRA